MSDRPRELLTTAEVMEALGGIGFVAKLTGRTYGAAFNWKGFAKFPSDTFLVMQGALRAAGFVAPASLWGMVPVNSDAEVRP